MSELIKIAGVQMDIQLADKEANLRAITAAAEEARRNGARVAVFPECAVTGYCFESLDEARPFAEPIPGPSTMQLVEVAQQLKMYLIFGLLERSEDRVFNACALVGPQGVIGTYRKIHLPYLGVDRFTTPGDQPFAVHDVDGMRVGMHICYDGAFPEAARVMALQGADLVVLPTNWPPGAECTADYVMNARAMENNIYFMSVDRIGVERGFRFIGKSKICDTNGNTLDFADHQDPAILYADIDVAKARNKRLVRVPGKHVIHRFNDRRPEFYGPIAAPKATSEVME